VYPLAWIDDTTPLPHPDCALSDGLLAAGGRLTVERLQEAYSKGIFPWYNAGDPILWWSPQPRMVLHCNELRISHSLGKRLRQIARSETTPGASVQVRLNTAFEQVMRQCAAPRNGMEGTWISPDIQAAYGLWHRQGQVHSIETWIDGRLAGGLYGVSLGRFFFGESMFSRANDASKIALSYLVAYLLRHGVAHIDCQQQTAHLARMGARPIDRHDFLDLLAQALEHPSPPWGRGQLLHTGDLASADAMTP